MSKFNEFVPMSYTVEISISNNTFAPPNPPDFSDDDPGGDVDVGEVDPPIDEEDYEVDEK